MLDTQPIECWGITSANTHTQAKQLPPPPYSTMTFCITLHTALVYGMGEGDGVRLTLFYTYSYLLYSTYYMYIFIYILYMM